MLTVITWVALAVGVACFLLALNPYWRHELDRWRDRDRRIDQTAAMPLFAAVLALAVAGATAAVHDKVHPGGGSARAERLNQTTAGLVEAVSDIPNFRAGWTLRDRVGKDLCVAQYYDASSAAGQGRSLNWWTTCSEADKLDTIQAVRQALALKTTWGKRDRQARARIPAGTQLYYLFGKASRQTEPGHVWGGGGPQFRFVNFDPSWIVDKRCPSNNTETKRVKWKKCD
jgi:hypothetical protein